MHVIAITGASAGIGRAKALRLGRKPQGNAKASAER